MTRIDPNLVRQPLVEPGRTSMFVNGHFPRRRGLIIALSTFAGFLLTVVWSAQFVDSVWPANWPRPAKWEISRDW